MVLSLWSRQASIGNSRVPAECYADGEGRRENVEIKTSFRRAGCIEEKPVGSHLDRENNPIKGDVNVFLHLQDDSLHRLVSSQFILIRPNRSPLVHSNHQTTSSVANQNTFSEMGSAIPTYKINAKIVIT